MSVNKVILIGHIGRDPETQQGSSGTQFVKTTLATSEKYKDGSGNWQSRTEWHNLIVWGNQADTFDQYVKKGQMIYIEGKIENRNYEDKDGVKRFFTQINVQKFTFLHGHNNDQNQ